MLEEQEQHDPFVYEKMIFSIFENIDIKVSSETIQYFDNTRKITSI
jgi:hypothetical protein